MGITKTRPDTLSSFSEDVIKIYPSSQPEAVALHYQVNSTGESILLLYTGPTLRKEDC